MCDQFDCNFIRARIPCERSGRELRQLLVIPFRKVRPNLPDVLLDDVEIVQEPVAGRTNVEPAFGAFVQFLIDSVENRFGVVESEQQWTHTTLLLRWKQMVAARNRASSLA